MSNGQKFLIRRNIQLYFKDKSTFLMSLLTPLILLALFVTFLGSVYKQSLISQIPEGVNISQNLIDSFSMSWLLSSLIGVSCVTVAFCSNIFMAQDKITGARHDLLVAPVKKSTLAMSYFLANVITTGIVCLTVTIIGFIYLSTIGWFFSVKDVVLIIIDVIISVLFGSSLAAIAENFISTQGGIGAVSSLVSSLYGFLCGAYMPISQFSPAIRNLVSLLPGTYNVGLLRNHYMNGIFTELSKKLPDEVIETIRDGFDANLYFFDNKVKIWQMYLIVIVSIIIFVTAFVIVNFRKEKRS